MQASRPFRLFFTASLLLASSPTLAESPQERARELLTRSLQAMGGRAPSDSELTADVREEAGSTVETGTLRVRTRGLDQSSERREVQSVQRETVYSRGDASERTASGTVRFSLELASTSRSTVVPVVFVAWALQDPDVVAEYVGSEALDTVRCHRLRISDSHASSPDLPSLAEFSVWDLWIAETGDLPVRLAWDRREAGGAAPRIAMATVWSDWRWVQGIRQPFRIEVEFNGTPWRTLVVEDARFDVGLNEADFAVE